MLNNRDSWKKFVAAMVLVVFCTSVFSSCATFRRKFVRKSKVKDSSEDVIPVLEPIEYKPVVHSSAQVYSENYSLFRAFYKDVWEVVGEGEGDKRERYILSQVVAKIDAMAVLLNPEKSTGLKKYSAEILSLMKELDKPKALRRYDLMKSELRTVENNIRKDFKPASVEPYLLQAQKAPEK
ncbi:MAG: hypothetical protein HQL16_04515 [Candidatus Omnitrophica bacterium]|nr:hypothetical protein [Candidatus Omnitrophota bacterium]